MTDTRAEFEAKFGPLGYPLGIDEDDGEYWYSDTHHAWLGWQAGAQAERLECMKICDKAANYWTLHGGDSFEGSAAAEALAIEIRDRGTPA